MLRVFAGSPRPAQRCVESRAVVNCGRGTRQRQFSLKRSGSPLYRCSYKASRRPAIVATDCFSHSRHRAAAVIRRASRIPHERRHRQRGTEPGKRAAARSEPQRKRATARALRILRSKLSGRETREMAPSSPSEIDDSHFDVRGFRGRPGSE